VIKTAEQEHRLKLAIRNEVARNPIISVVQLQNVLKERGLKTAKGNPLDWRYVSKLVRKLNREKAMTVDQRKVNERLAITKEQYRVIIERLWRIWTTGRNSCPSTDVALVALLLPLPTLATAEPRRAAYSRRARIRSLRGWQDFVGICLRRGPFSAYFRAMQNSPSGPR
jgi:hypothetical protein